MTATSGRSGPASRPAAVGEHRPCRSHPLRMPALLAGAIVALAAGGCGVSPQADGRAPTGAATACQWHWMEAGPLRVRVEECRHATGHWRVRHDPALPGLALWRDGERVQTVLHWLRKPESQGVQSVMAQLQAGGHVPPGDDCVFRPVSGPAVPPGTQRHEIRPAGQRLKAFEATPKDEIPDPPCGAYGWSTHGVRWFVVDPRHPRWVVYVNAGQDGTLIDPATLAIGD